MGEGNSEKSVLRVIAMVVIVAGMLSAVAYILYKGPSSMSAFTEPRSRQRQRQQRQQRLQEVGGVPLCSFGVQDADSKSD